MIYEEYFTTEWESLTRDGAMVRAFVLGIDSVRGEEPEGELDRLREADTRAFVEMAYGAGQRKCRDVEEEATSRRDEADRELQSVEASDVVSELIVPRRDGRDGRDETGRPGAGSTVDVPAMLDRFEFLDTRPDDRERLNLPEFLRR